MTERYLRHKKSGIIARYSEDLVATRSYIEIGEPEYERSKGLGSSNKEKPPKRQTRKKAAKRAVTVTTDDELSADELDQILGDGSDD